MAEFRFQDLIQCYEDQYVQVRTDDGKLLGVVPNFGADISQIRNKHGQTLSVGVVAMRAVHVPTGQGFNPYDLYDFKPAPGVRNEVIELKGLGQAGQPYTDPDVAKGI